MRYVLILSMQWFGNYFTMRIIWRICCWLFIWMCVVCSGPINDKWVNYQVKCDIILFNFNWTATQHLFWYMLRSAWWLTSPTVSFNRVFRCFFPLSFSHHFVHFVFIFFTAVRSLNKIWKETTTFWIVRRKKKKNFNLIQ